MWKRIYWKSFRGVIRYILLMSIVMNFAPGVDMMLLNRIFAVSSQAAFVLTSPSYFNWSPLAVILVWSCSAFSGHISQHTRVYVAFLFAWICCLWIQWHVSVPFTHWVPSSFLPMPWNSLPNSLAPDFVQTSLNFGCLIRCRYSSFRLVSLSKTELAYILYSCGIQSLRWYHVDWRCSAAFAKPPEKGTASFLIRGLLRLPDWCTDQYSCLIRWNLVDVASIAGPSYVILLLPSAIGISNTIPDPQRFCSPIGHFTEYRMPQQN